MAQHLNRSILSGFNAFRLPHDICSQSDWQGVVIGLEEGWFYSAPCKGSHHFIHHHDGRSTVVPVHSGETIVPGLFAKILRDCDLNREQFQKLL